MLSGNEQTGDYVLGASCGGGLNKHMYMRSFILCVDMCASLCAYLVWAHVCANNGCFVQKRGGHLVPSIEV